MLCAGGTYGEKVEEPSCKDIALVQDGSNVKTRQPEWMAGAVPNAESRDLKQWKRSRSAPMP